MVYANIAGYLAAAAGGLVLGTLLGTLLRGKFTTAIMSMVHALETRIARIEGGTGNAAAVDGTALQAAAIGAHAPMARRCKRRRSAHTRWR
jgi:hypothetical protein